MVKTLSARSFSSALLSNITITVAGIMDEREDNDARAQEDRNSEMALCVTESSRNSFG